MKARQAVLVEPFKVEIREVALPAPAPMIERVTARLDGDDVLVLVTDGMANPVRDGPETVAPALAAALADPPGAIDLAALLDFSRQGCHDDRTLVGVWRSRPPTS